jgi:hypothetical protein
LGGGPLSKLCPSAPFCIQDSSFWPFEEISIFSNGGHLGYRTALTDTILKGTHPWTIPARFGLIWFSGRIFYEL